MPSATAAYCTACRAYVLVALDGGCEFGHTRPNLRGIYVAALDRRTARPLPPSADQRALAARPVAPVAPAAEYLSPAIPAQAPHAGAPQHGSAADSVSWAAPVAPVAMGTAPRPAAESRGFLAQLFGPPRGRHAIGARERWGR